AVGLRARVAVVAGRAARGDRVRAHARERVARTGAVTLVGGRADDRAGPRAEAVQTGVDLGARVVVIAAGAVGEGGGRARAEHRGARAGRVALVARRANDRVAAGADARLARVRLRAQIVVVAARPVGDGGVRASAGGRVAGAGAVALVGRRADDRRAIA